MQTVHVYMHRDGDKLVIVNSPWWTTIYEKVMGRFCPCCSWRGWLLDKITNFDKEENEYRFREKFYIRYFDKWGRLYTWSAKFEKVVYETTITDACLASQKIFKQRQSCWRDDCEDCWELREDAYRGK